MYNNTDLVEIFISRLNDFESKNLIINRYSNTEMFIHDHLGGFTEDFKNAVLDKIPAGVTVRTEYLPSASIKLNYPNLVLQFDADMMVSNNHLLKFVNRVTGKQTEITHFLGVFMHRYYPERGRLAAWLHELGWLDLTHSSKNFKNDRYPAEVEFLYTKYIGNDFNSAEKTASRQQMQQSVSFYGDDPNDHSNHIANITHISRRIQKSFVCIVPESHPDHFYPFPTEKFLYPILNGTLWVAQAQTGYHAFIRDRLGFRLHDCFDYSFDQIPDHVERMYVMTKMLEKFSLMSRQDWDKVYKRELDTLEFNAAHLNSGEFVKRIRAVNESRPIKNILMK